MSGVEVNLLGAEVLQGQGVVGCGANIFSDTRPREVNYNAKTPQEHYDNAVAVLSQIRRTDPGNGPASFYVASEKKVFQDEDYDDVKMVSETGGVCHFRMSLNDGIPARNWSGITMASNFNFKPEHALQSLMFWLWLIDAEKSPWRKILTKGPPTIIMDRKNEHMTGFYFNMEQLKLADFLFFKNFCIAARGVYEHPGHIAAWADFLEGGLSPADAYILCSFYHKGKNGYYYLDDEGADGGHWPLTLLGRHDGGNFHYHRFANGDPRDGKGYINGCWAGDSHHANTSKELSSINKRAAKVLRGNFTVTKVYDVPALIELFLEWKAKHGYNLGE